MENTTINYRATVVLTNPRSSSSFPDVFTVEHQAEDFNSFIAMVADEFSGYDECLITNIEVFSKSNYTVKYIKGERVL